MKRLSPTEYKRRKSLKQKIKSIPEKETKVPLLKTYVRRCGYSFNDNSVLMSMLLMRAMSNKRRR